RVSPARALARRQGLGKRKSDGDGVQARQRRGRDERRTRAESGHESADRRTEDETHAEGGPDQAERGAALFGRGYVGEHGIGRAEGGPRYSGDEAAEEKPADRR